VIDPLARGHSHAERHSLGDLSHDQLDASEVVEVLAGQFGADGLVTAADVVADPRQRHIALIGNRAADRLAVARVVVGTQHAVLRVTGIHAAL
jgi:hypothetical protein